MKILNLCSISLLFCFLGKASAGDFISLNDVKRIQCVGIDDDNSYSLDIVRLRGDLFDVRLKVIDGDKSKIVFKMKANGHSFPVYGYDHEWLDTDNSYGSPNAPYVLNRVFLSQGVELGPLEGKLTIESYAGFDERTFVEVKCRIQN